ncbi:MAG: FAD-dependent oxidoreductase [Armatimonadota bacterium]|nr:FAD-dependent oxidoreductase [Armatimonadota bacterium]MDR7438886.1 FAD-dependent oxidoreductase [Armatimonadota bacterium]MDR7562426.1 FAD-dependent oxidoreductase [Armatimonadota bacterium]MDR7568694.1 FAD-dependent oxidoreductase [Armatimonadota bacterium]MDR7601506.1 FAD-dependent oxidoreductase [Armatimonadota bacterium]
MPDAFAFRPVGSAAGSTVSLWLDVPYAPRPPLRGEVQVPVAVVGGGITGISVAYWLSRAGVTCWVLERDVVAGGATGRNGGFVQEGTTPGYADLIARFGRSEAKALWAFTVENRERLLQVCAEEGIEAEVDPRGSVALASDLHELEELEREAALLTEDGFPVHLLDAEEVRARLGGHPEFVGGMFNPRDIGIHPVRFTRGLAAAAERRGARIFEGTPVVGIERAGTGWRAVTPAGTVQADRLVLALDAYTTQLETPWARWIRAVRGQVLATAPLPRRLFAHLFYANDGLEYWRQTPAGPVVLGGLRRLHAQEEVGTEDRLHPRIQEALEAYLRGLGVPRGVAVTHRWSGAIGLSRDHLPVIGPVPGEPGLLLAAGYTGQGLAFAFLAGRMITELLVAGSTDSPHVLLPDRLVGRA